MSLVCLGCFLWLWTSEWVDCKQKKNEYYLCPVLLQSLVPSDGHLCLLLLLASGVNKRETRFRGF